MSEIYTLEQTAEYLKLHKSTIVRKIKEGKLKAKNIGGPRKPDYRIKAEWINEYLNN